MENLALVVLGVIILVDAVAMTFVLWYGNQHDANKEVSDVASSQAVARIYSTYTFLEAAKSAQAAPALMEPVTDTSVTDPVVDEAGTPE